MKFDNVQKSKIQTTKGDNEFYRPIGKINLGRPQKIETLPNP